jgi:reactive chlorine resistance protein C
MPYVRYGLVAILVYYGFFNFSAVQADAIKPLVEHSPLLSWIYGLMDPYTAAKVLGVTEIVIAALIALRFWSTGACIFGSLLAAGMFLVTLSFLFTTPGMWLVVADFPVKVPSQTAGFLLKDFFLLGAAGWSAGEARRVMTVP